MKKILIVLATGLTLFACKTTDKKNKTPEEIKRDSTAAAEKMIALKDTANYTTIQWLDSTSMDLGKVKEGKIVEVSYRFKNTGDKPLVVANVTASCGCTIPEKPEQPIAPGAEGEIKAKFNSEGRKGSNEKHIYVDANTKPKSGHELSFKVEVE